MSASRPALSMLREERGIALVLTLFTMTFFAMVLTTLVYYTTANTSATSRHKADQQAYALAEAGLNNATSKLYAASDPTNSGAVPSTTETLSTGTTTYSGSLSGNFWTITASGSARNPAATNQVTRHVSQKVEIIYTPDMTIWGYLFSDTTTGPCMSTDNNAIITSPLYVRGKLCVANNAHFTGSPLQVEGTVTIANDGSVGYSNAPIAVAKLKLGCTGGNPNPHPCTSADRVYATTITNTPDGLTKPPVDLDYWYQNASPGPMNDCTSGTMPGGFDNNTVMNRSRPAFNLMPSTAYSCQTSSGQISWAPGNPGTLTISGVVFFDGNIVTNNDANGVYSGKGTIYTSGSIVFANNAKLCGVAGCNNSWNTAQNVLMFVAGAPSGYGFDLSNNNVFQGAAYVVANYRLDNNSVNWGPVVANQLYIDNNAGQAIPLLALPPGAPAWTIRSLQVVPSSYSG